MFQLPPNLRCDLDRLDGLLALLPDGTPAALEFRHESWFDEAVFEKLRSRNLPVVIVDAEEDATPDVIATADWGYLRLRRPGYDEGEIRAWADRVAGAAWSRALVYFKHEDAGAGPELAARFLAATGAPAKRAPAVSSPAKKTPERKRTARARNAG